MKLWKNLIRIWLTLVSLASFLVGWVVIAHAPKPGQFQPANVLPANVPAMPKLDPVPSLDQVMNSNQSQTQNFSQSQPAQSQPAQPQPVQPQPVQPQPAQPQPAQPQRVQRIQRRPILRSGGS